MGEWDHGVPTGPTRVEREPGWALAGRDRARRPKGQTQKPVFVAVLVGWNVVMPP
jgi:hypothetical protein